MKKKLVLTVGLVMCLACLISTPASAQMYDGLWISPFDPSSFTLMVEDGSLLLAVLFDLKGEYLVLFGQMEEKAATVTSVFPPTLQITGTVTFTSANSGTLRIDACKGDCSSMPPIGIPLLVNRVWPMMTI